MKQNGSTTASQGTDFGSREEKPGTAGANWRRVMGLDVSGAGPFRLLRYFSIVSAVVLAAAISVLVVLYRHIATNELVVLTEFQNVALARSFANALWPRFSPYLTSAAGMDGDALRARPETEQIHLAMTRLTEGFPVLKVKIYDSAGLTVYSSAFGQIGEDKSKNAGFLSAAERRIPATKISYRGEFSAFSGVHYDRHLVETYIPIPAGDGPVEGVFELYTDVTMAVDGIDHATRVLAASMVAAFGVLYVVLFLVVRRADRIILGQYDTLQQSKEVIDGKNLELEHEIEIRRRAEAQLAQHHKLKSLGDLAGGLAHNLLNLLQPVMLLSEQVREGVPEDSQDRKKLDVINQASKQARDLVNRIRLFGREGEVSEERFEIAEVVNDGLELVLSMAPQNVTLVTDVNPDTGAVVADRALLQTVLVNLANNAFYAIGKERGQVTVSLGRISVGRYGETSVPGLKPGDYAKITVADTGAGMDREIIERIFDPFFTTKEQGIGTGLGLSSAYGIVKRQGGVITVDSAPGKGSRFDVFVPLAGEQDDPTE